MSIKGGQLSVKLLYSSSSLFFCGVNAMMMRMLMSVSLYHSAVPTSFPRQICPSSRHTLPANDLYPVYVEICTFLENGFLLF